jgi:hypothetical protein
VLASTPRQRRGRSWRRREPAGRAERGILVEHGLVQAPQLGTGLDPQFADELPPDVGVGLQRLRLPTGAIQREHLLPAQPLAQRMRGRQRGQLAHQVGMAANREVGIDAVLQGRQSKLLDSRRFGLQRRLVGQVGERRAAPELEPVSQQVGGTVGIPRRKRGPAASH